MDKFLAVIIFLCAAAVQIQSLAINDDLCDRQLNYFDQALDQRERWALFVFDTWAKFESGVFRGNLVVPGGFTDCVNFRHQSNNTQIGIIQGQHCMVNFSPRAEASEIVSNGRFDWREIGRIAREENYNFRHGFCLPASCSSEKVLNFMNRYLNQGDFEGLATTCQTNDPVPYEVLDIIAIVIFSFIGFLLLSCTIYEVIKITRKEQPNQLFAAFSCYTNGWKLYDVTQSSSPSDIRCLHGIRALSILYIIFGHRYGVTLGHVISNGAFLGDWFTQFYIGLYHTHQVPVDVFFMMGGLLVVWSMLKSLDNNRLNILRSYLLRYIRYTPLLAAILLFVVTLLKHIVFGPLSTLYTGSFPLIPNCEKWWWTTLLHVQNYVNPNEICMSHTWYLSVDFQLFLLSPFLIYPAWKYGWKYMWTMPALALLSSIYIFVMSLVYKIYIVTKTPDAASFEFFIQWIYYPTHARMGPWLIGMTLGYILYQNRHKKIRLNPIFNITMWILSLTVFVAIMMGSQIMFLPPAVNETSLLANAFYLAFYRNGWALASAWMVFACHNGTGGIIRWLLQLPQWQPIGRMGLSWYLTSYMFQLIIVMISKTTIYFDEFEMLHHFWGDIVATVFLGTIGYLAFEVPFTAVENYVHRLIQERKLKVTKC